MAFTYFFRDLQTDAGCAHGPEPYSIAILLRENMSHFLFRNVRIFATDIDTSRQFAEILAKGHYPLEEIKRIPSAIRQKYFTPLNGNGVFQLDDAIRARVTFTRHDLLSLEPVRSGLGLIVCKNVLLHFDPLRRVEVLKMFHSSLASDGFLVVEQTQKLPGEVRGLFEQVSSDGQMFRKVEAGG